MKINIRLTGTISECLTFADSLRENYDVQSISAFYPNRGTDSGRIYVDITMEEE